MFHREGQICSVDTVQITDGLITTYSRGSLVSRMKTDNGRRKHTREQVRSIMQNGIHPLQSS